MSYYDSDSDSDDADGYYPRHRKPHYPDRAESVQCTPDPTPSELEDNKYPNPTPLEPNYHSERHNNGTDRKDETGAEWETESEIDEGYEPKGLECEDDKEYTHGGMDYETEDNEFNPEGLEFNNGEVDAHREPRTQGDQREPYQLTYKPDELAYQTNGIGKLAHPIQPPTTSKISHLRPALIHTRSLYTRKPD
jgi:hypothetical protein